MKSEHGISVAAGTVSNVKNRPELTHPVQADKKVGDLNWREWLPAIQQIQALKKRASYSQDRASIVLGDGTQPVALGTFSDMHMGAWSTDHELLRECTDDFLAIPNLYLALLGDYGHYAIKMRNVLEVSDNLLPPETQTEFLESWLDEIKHKIAFATWENHGVERQEKQAGESSTKRLLSRNVVYFNGIGHVDIQVGDQTYLGAASNAFRGRSIENPVHGQMRYMRREGIDREFAMAGDSHVPGMAKYTDGAKLRVATNCGSLQTNSGYGKRYFSLSTHPTFPVIVFRHDRHEMTPFWSVKEWLASK